MKNFEYYEKEIKKIIENDCDIALRDGKPVECEGLDYHSCNLIKGPSCQVGLVKWLYEEHVEKPKINKRTKLFFDALETGYVARDKYGELFYTDVKPIKKINFRHWAPDDDCSGWKEINLTQLPFLSLDFITWEDEKPWTVEDIRKLEVIDDEIKRD